MSKFNQRTLNQLRDEGYEAEVVERFNFFTKRKNDLFGFIDIVAIHPDKKGVLAVQFTNYANFGNHVTKIRSIPEHDIWLRAGNEIQVWGYKPVKYGKVIRYELRRESLLSEEQAVTYGEGKL